MQFQESEASCQRGDKNTVPYLLQVTLQSSIQIKSHMEFFLKFSHRVFSSFLLLSRSRQRVKQKFATTKSRPLSKNDTEACGFHQMHQEIKQMMVRVFFFCQRRLVYIVYYIVGLLIIFCY